MAFSTIKSVATSVSNVLNDNSITRENIAGIQSSTKKYRPVYRVAITYPVTNLQGEIKPYTKIIAETSTEGGIVSTIIRHAGLGISDVLGMWIDSDDVAEPDKCVVLFRIDPELSKNTLEGNESISDEYLTHHRLFSVRNWLDVWIGYEIEPSLAVNIPLVTEKKGNIYPEFFGWYSETHLFSGPIVLVDRTINSNGDRMSITGFSAETILMQSRLMSVSNSSTYRIQMRRDPHTKEKYLRDVMLELFKSIVSYSEWEKKRKDATTFDKIYEDDAKLVGILFDDELLDSFLNQQDGYFVIGDFYWELMKDTIEEIIAMLENGSSSDNKKGRFPILDSYIGEDVFTAKDKFLMKSPVVIHKQPSFWEALQFILMPEISNLGGMGFRITKRISWANKFTPDSVIEGLKKKDNTFRAGMNVTLDVGHPGVKFQFFFAMEVDEIQELDRNIQTRFQYVPQADLPEVVLGNDVMELEAYLDYSTVFNSFRIFTRTYDRSAKFDLFFDRKPRETLFPIDAQDFINTLDSENRKLQDFWKAVLLDIRTYGEVRFPIAKWFAVPLSEVEKENMKTESASALDDAIRNILSANVELSKAMGHDGIAAMFKRYYFGGLEGTVYCVGNPSLKVNRYLRIRDVRKAFSTALNEPDKLTEVATNLANKVLDKIGIGLGVTYSEDTPMQLITNFVPPVNKRYFIWKVRHYYGPQSGFVTKAYFTQARSRAWRLVTRDVAGMLRQAQRVAREVK